MLSNLDTYLEALRTSPLELSWCTLSLSFLSA